MTISNVEAALLGLLSEEPMHPYKIEQEVQYRDMRSWAGLSMSSIYKQLKKLEKDGLVERENKISSENRLQKHYTISKKGTEVFQEKIEQLLSSPEHTKWQVDIGIYNANLLSEEKIHKTLTKYKGELQEKIKGYEALLKFLQDSNCPKYRFEIAKRPIFLLEAEIVWVNDYLKTLTES